VVDEKTIRSLSDANLRDLKDATDRVGKILGVA